MKERIKLAFVDFLLYFLFTIVAFLFHYFYNQYSGVELNYKIHFFIGFFTFIVIGTTLSLYILELKNKIGFLYLGFVVFKMFGMAYLTLFELSFKEHVISYFVIFWAYLVVEALLVIKCLQKQDKNHVKHIEE